MRPSFWGFSSECTVKNGKAKKGLLNYFINTYMSHPENRLRAYIFYIKLGGVRNEMIPGNVSNPISALIVVAAEIMISGIHVAIKGAKNFSNPRQAQTKEGETLIRARDYECHDEINLITNELNLICLLAIFQVIKITKT